MGVMAYGILFTNLGRNRPIIAQNLKKKSVVNLQADLRSKIDCLIYFQLLFNFYQAELYHPPWNIFQADADPRSPWSPLTLWVIFNFWWFSTIIDPLIAPLILGRLIRNTRCLPWPHSLHMLNFLLLSYVSFELVTVKCTWLAWKLQ